MIRLLVEHGADVNERDVSGETPLEIARTWNHDHPEVIRYLEERTKASRR